MIVVFGSINLDLMVSLPELPMPGQTLLAGASRIEPGGKGANQAVAAARDGASVLMVGAVGDDVLADAALGGLIEAGVDVSRVARTPAATGFAVVATDAAGQNQIIVAPGANLLARAAQVDDACLTPGSILLVQMETDPAETLAILRHAKSRGARTILNLAPAKEVDPALLQALDFLVLNEDEAAFVGGMLGAPTDAVSLHQALGIGVVRTLGSAGAEAAVSGEHIRILAEPIKAVDTTAAGDCFTGVLAAALDRGVTLRDAMARAGMAAALACTRPGSQGSLPARQAIDGALLRKRLIGGEEPAGAEP